MAGFSVFIPMNYHPMKKVQMMIFAHGAKVFLVSRQPSECLLAAHEIYFRVIFMDIIGIVFISTFFIDMVLEVKSINHQYKVHNLLNVSNKPFLQSSTSCQKIQVMVMVEIKLSAHPICT